MIILTLPFPVSVNEMYRNKLKGRAKSERYMIWARAAGWELKAQRQKPIHGSYTMTLCLYEADNRRRDPDNFVKGVSDLLVTHGLIDDDHLCSSMHIDRFKADKQRCEVIVRPSNGIPSEAYPRHEAEE